MSPSELQELIGRTVHVSSRGDLYFNADLRPILRSGGLGPPVTLVKITKGGMALVRADDGREYSVPPRNVDSPTQQHPTRQTEPPGNEGHGTATDAP